MKIRPLFWSSCILIGWVLILVGISWWQKEQIVYPLNRDFLRHQVLGDYTYQASKTGTASANLGIVYGFLPYWSVDNYQIDNTVSHVSYFRLAIDADGNLSDDGGAHIYESDRMQQIFDQIERQNIKLEVTFFTSHSDDIYNLVNCEKCQKRLLDNIAQVVEKDRLDGVNLDLEYLGTLTRGEQQKMTFFLYDLKNMLLEKFPRTKLSIDVYGGAASMENNLWDWSKIGQIVDRVIVMGYDYRTRRADTPGSSSPTLSDNIWGGNIWDDIISLERFVESDRIILAVPFYGYAWETTTCDLETAKTYPDTGQTLTYRGAQNMLNNPLSDAVEYWDSSSLTPYLVFTDDGIRSEQTENEQMQTVAGLPSPLPESADSDQIETSTGDNGEKRCHIGFFENQRSLEYKIDLIENLHLGGIAIWALGYEGEYQQLWETIDSRF
ncbi:hypothetical protein IJJ08_02015 [bacterium]|nr:hypothetical protein [bacterium]